MSQRYIGGLATLNPPVQNPALGNAANGVFSMSQYFSLKTQGSWPAIDPYWEYVTLMLHGNGTNGAQNNTFLDSSTNNFTITRNGNTTQGAFSPYGDNWSNFFDGSGDFLTAPSNAAFDFGTSNFTIETWGYRTSSGSWGSLISRRSAGANYGPFFLGVDPSNVPYFLCSSSGSSWLFLISGSALPLNTWFHLAGVRNGNTFTLYVNGVSVGTASSSASLMASSVAACIGAHADGSEPFAGYISNAHIVKGTAVYTANFTPSTTPLTAITNTSLLTCQSNRFIDNSTNAFAITPNGNVGVQRFSPFHPTAPYAAGTIGGSGYFDGSGDYLTAPDNAAFDLGSGNLSIELFVYITAYTPGNLVVLFSNYQDTSNGWTIGISGSTSKFYGSISGNTTLLHDPNSPILNAWNHVVLCRTGSTLSLFVNGARAATTTDTTNITSTSNVHIGAAVGGSFNFTGYISNARVIKGSSPYDATQTTLTVPASPLTAITNTSLLLNFTNGGIIDNAMMNDLETVGNAQISTSVSRFGGGSLAFDGTGDYLVGPSTPQIGLGSGDFTIELWVYLTANFDSTGKGLVTASFNTNFAVIGVNTGGGNRIDFYVANTLLGTGTNYISLNTWTHLAFVRASGTTKIYFNGAEVASSGSLTGTGAAAAIFVGTLSHDTPRVMTGYIDDLRITKGYARYTANFTPQRSQWQDQ